MPLAPASFLLVAIVLSGCPSAGVLVAPPVWTDGDRPVAAIDGEDLLDSIATDHPGLLVEDVAAAVGVPPELLGALAWVESGFATLQGERAGWLGLDAAAITEGASLTGLAPTAIQSDPGAHLLAGAALLDALRADVAPAADPTALDAAWWPVLTAWADTGVPWLDDAFALDVLLAVQRGLVAPTEETEAEFVSITPREVSGLGDIVLAVPPALQSEYPGALRIDGAGEERTEPVRRIVLRAAESAWVRAAVEGDAHYVVRGSDGRVAERMAADHTATEDDALAVDLSGGAASPGSFTVQSMEASARLVGWLARTHDLEVDVAVEISLGPHFPLAPWMAMVRCYEAQGSGCDTGLAGGVLASAWPVTELADDEDGAGEGRSLARDVPSVPYFYQYANARHPSASCQNTSIAMVLAWLGWSGTPDTITARFGKDLAQSPAGLAQVFNTLAAEAGLEARLTARTSGTLAGMNALLAEGTPVIVHGYQTGYGHVLVALGRDGSDYVVNDPAGRWAERFKGGYPYGWNGSVGRGIRYARGPFEAAIATSNGSSPLPLWYHELTGVEASSAGGPSSEESPSEEPSGDPLDGTDGGELPPAGGAPGTSSTQFYDWADVAWIRPGDGNAVSNPVTLEARRWNGQTTEFLAGSWLLGSSSANPAVTTKEFSQLGLRSVTARNLSVWGTVLAETTITVDVTEQQASECAVVGEISCGQTVSGDNGSAEASYAIDGYPGVVGNWSGPEMAWTWSGGAGEVTIRLIDPRPSELNHDILILEQSAGVCVAPDQVDVAWNALTFEPTPGAAYTFVVDAHQDLGPFQMELECGG